VNTIIKQQRTIKDKMGITRKEGYQNAGKENNQVTFTAVITLVTHQRPLSLQSFSNVLWFLRVRCYISWPWRGKMSKEQLKTYLNSPYQLHNYHTQLRVIL